MEIHGPMETRVKYQAKSLSAVLEIRMWSILLINLDLKWCIHLSRSAFLYFNYLVNGTAGGPESPRGYMLPSSSVYFVDS